MIFTQREHLLNRNENSPSTGPCPLGLVIPSDLALLIIIPTLIDLTQPCRICPSSCLGDKSLDISTYTSSTHHTRCTIGFTGVYQLELTQFVGIDLVLKFQVLIWSTPVFAAISTTTTLISTQVIPRSGISGACKTL